MDLLGEIKKRAQANLQHIVLPEGNEPRTLEAANRVLRDKVARLTLLGNVDEIMAMAHQKGFEMISPEIIVDPKTSEKAEEYANLLFELRKNKGMSIEEARQKVQDPLYFGCLMIKSGHADGQLAGAINTTGNVLRPALQIIKTAKGFSCVSGAMILISNQKQYGEEGIIVCGDIAVLPQPSTDDLAQIAVATGRTMKAICGFEPRVAMLSFSTKGSAKNELVDRVVEATKKAQEMAPDMMIDGELQADAALVEAVGSLKCPGSPVAGKANTLVFPSLETGNIAYKLVQRLGGAIAIGPILQGIAAPINDLSRGCSVEDVEKMIAITCNQAIAAKK